jgi:hypothetical protein
MGWGFETDPEYQAQLDWADALVREEVSPLDLLWTGGISSLRMRVCKASLMGSSKRFESTSCGPQL